MPTINLMGTIDEYGNIDLHENAPDGTPSGHFSGRYDDGVFEGEFVNYKQQHMDFHLRTATSGSPRPQSGSDIYEYDDDDDEYVYEDEDDDYEDDQDSYTAPATSGNTSAKGRQALADTEAFVKKLERLSKLTESDANRLDAEFNSLSSKYDDLKESDFSASDYKKMVELKNRIERARNRLVYGQ